MSDRRQDVVALATHDRLSAFRGRAHRMQVRFASLREYTIRHVLVDDVRREEADQRIARLSVFDRAHPCDGALEVAIFDARLSRPSHLVPPVCDGGSPNSPHSTAHFGTTHPPTAFSSSIRPSLRSRGTPTPIATTTPNDANPPKITDGTVPSSRAATPDSNAPSSFDEPTKIEFTDDTRPSMCDGVSTCSSVDRTSTLTLSAIPLAASNSAETVKLRDTPKPMMQTANVATAMSSVRPARRKGGRCARNTDAITAHDAGAARRMPSPCGPTCR